MHMRTLFLVTTTFLFLSSCSNKNGKSDAFGNFETVEVLVSTEMSGKLLEFSAEEGKIYKAGDILGLIDTVQLSLKRDQIVAQRKASSSKIANIQSQIDVQLETKKSLDIDKDRIEKLVKDKAVPTKQLDDINGKINVIESQVASIKTQNSAVLSEITSMDRQIDQITDQIKRCKVVNPINGSVLEKYVEPTEIVAPGKALYKIADMEQMNLRVYISGAQLPAVKIGQKVKVLIDKDEKGTESLEGAVTWISSQAEFTPKIIQTKEERVNLVYAMKISVKNDGRLKIGMPGEVKFQ
jgi:HlyD family secretion protein